MAKAETVQTGLQRMDAATLRRWLDEERALLLDVREAGEYAAAHIPGSVLVPLSTFDPAQVPHEDGKELVLHCKAGMRARDAANRLLKAGYERVWCFEGGILDWIASGYPTAGTEATAADPHARPVAAAPKLDVQRQTQTLIGTMIVAFTLLGGLADPRLGWLCLIPGLGLLNAGLTGLCPLASGVAKCPWNRR